MVKVGGRRDLERELMAAGTPERAASSVWFFKMGPGQYGAGDQFIGISVPVQRRIALQYRDLPFKDLERLLESPLHEFRFVALEILVDQYEKGSPETREEIFRFYLDHTGRINNWDLVDTSAPYIVGEHVKVTSRKVLDELALSENVWERRIAIVATLGLIRGGEVRDTFRIANKLLTDKHDLIRKAVGWALREAGKVSTPALVKFLRQHYAELSRTTLRYAIERFPARERGLYLKGDFAKIEP